MRDSASPALLASLEPSFRQAVLAGFRWTLWLAIAGLPLGLAARLLLARAGAEVLGAYGVLLLYSGFTATLLFFGGNAVAIRFLPSLPAARRGPFLARYGAVVLLGLVPWWMMAAIWPRGLHFLFGDLAGIGAQRLLIALAPLPILFSLLTSALKGLLEIKSAQLIARATTSGSLLVYALLSLFARDPLRAHCTALLWGVYFCLSAAACGGAWRRLRRHLPRGGEARRWDWPAGFWGYTLGLQGNSAITFFSRQLDMILILQLGGTRALGIYLAWLTLIQFAPTLLTVLLDALLPSLTNALARGSAAAVQDLTATVGRLLLPSAFAAAVVLLFFPAPIAGLFGAPYAAVTPWLRWAAPLAAIVAASNLLGTLFTAAGQPQRLIAAHLARIAIYAAAFPPLWRRDQLAGAVMAWMAAELAFHAAALARLRRLPPLPAGLRRAYAALWPLLALAATATALASSSPPAVRGALAALLIAAYLQAGGYSRRELSAWKALLAAPAPTAPSQSFRLEAR
ncbi:MAG: lipopolysaccharide biosynthesis protein [Terriglobales bacterium]